MSKQRVHVESIEKVTPEHVEQLKNGEIMLSYATKRGAWRTVSYAVDSVIYQKDGTVEKRYAWKMWDGRKWSGLTNEAAEVFAPEIAERRRARRAEQKRKAAEDAKAAADSISVGDVFYSSWGWEQTNVDFYQVVEKRGQFVTIRPIAGTYERKTWGSGVTSAIPGAFTTCHRWTDEENERGKRFKVGAGGTLRLTGFAHAWPWDGKPKHWSDWA